MIYPSLISMTRPRPSKRTVEQIEAARVENQWADLWMDEFIKDAEKHIEVYSTEEIPF